MTLGSANVSVCICECFWKADLVPQTHRHIDRDTQTEGGKRRRKERRWQGSREGREKKVTVRGVMEAVGVD